MRRNPTTAILVIAILHLVGGGIGLLGSLCSCSGLLMSSTLSSFMPAPPTFPARPGQPPPPMPPSATELMKQMSERVPGYRAFTISSLAFDFLLDVLLISAGIGLLKMQSWARWLSLVYAPLSILFHIGSFVYQIVWVIPALTAIYAESMQGMTALPGFASIMKLSTGAGAVVTLLVLIYPVAVIIILLLPSTTAAFRDEVSVRDDDLHDEEEYEEDHWEKPPPRSDKFRQ